MGSPRASVYRWIKAGRVTALRDPKNKHWLIMVEDLESEDNLITEENVDHATSTVEAQREP